MQFSYVFSELGTVLRRNVTMTISLVVTIFVSLTLVGMGLLLNSQADKAEDYLGSRLQITAFMCNDNSVGATCLGGEATSAQRQAVEAELDSNPQVADWYVESKAEAYEKFQEIYAGKAESRQRIFQTVKPRDLQVSYWVQLKDPQRFAGIESALLSMPGVDTVRDLRDVLKPLYFWMDAFKWGAIGTAGCLLIAAMLQVGNTIRMAVYSRRREIGIMRLVGASRAYIQMPFVLESVLAAFLGIALAAGAIGAFMHYVVYGVLVPNSDLIAWVGWEDAIEAMVYVSAVGTVLVLVPTLVMTRKYLKV